ncbi:MAG: LysM peptidoglycan-binding domain-containing protein [Planctomycetaceae bacterium]|nr:LysM peptidoglycan-binding domain-containing protein [Planctomycetaceae bacterium]
MTGMTDVSRHGGDKKNRNDAHIKVRDDALVDFGSEEPGHDDLHSSPSPVMTLIDDSDDDAAFGPGPGTATKIVQFAAKTVFFPIILLYRCVVSVRHVPRLCGKIRERVKRSIPFLNASTVNEEKVQMSQNKEVMSAKNENTGMEQPKTKHRGWWYRWHPQEKNAEEGTTETTTVATTSAVTSVMAVGAKGDNTESEHGEADRNGTRRRWYRWGTGTHKPRSNWFNRHENDNNDRESSRDNVTRRSRWHWKNWGWKKRDADRNGGETVHEIRHGIVVTRVVICLITIARYTGILWVSRKCSALAGSFFFWQRTRRMSAEERALEREIRAEETAKRNQASNRTSQNIRVSANVTETKTLSQQQQLQQAKTSLAAKVYSQHQQSQTGQKSGQQAGQNETKPDKISAAFRSSEVVASRNAATPVDAVTRSTQANADFVDDDQTHDPFAEQSNWGLMKSSMFALACLLLIGVCFYGGKYLLHNSLGTIASRNDDGQDTDRAKKTSDAKETKPGVGNLSQNDTTKNTVKSSISNTTQYQDMTPGMPIQPAFRTGDPVTGTSANNVADQSAIPQPTTPSFGTLPSNSLPVYNNTAAFSAFPNNVPEQETIPSDDSWGAVKPPVALGAGGYSPDGNGDMTPHESFPDATLAVESEKTTGFHVNVESEPVDAASSVATSGSIAPQPMIPQQNAGGLPATNPVATSDGLTSGSLMNNGLTGGSLAPGQLAVGPLTTAEPHAVETNDNPLPPLPMQTVSPQENPLAVITTGMAERQETTRSATGATVAAGMTPQAMIAGGQPVSQPTPIPQIPISPYAPPTQQTVDNSVAFNPLALPTEESRGAASRTTPMEQTMGIAPSAVSTQTDPRFAQNQSSQTTSADPAAQPVRPTRAPRAVQNIPANNFMDSTQKLVEDTRPAGTGGMGLPRNNFNETNLLPPVEVPRSIEIVAPSENIQTPPQLVFADNNAAAPPAVPSMPQPAIAGQPPMQNPVMPQLVPTQGGYREYEVKPGDSIYRIAKRELNNVLRFREIYELNQDKLPRDQHKLTPGTILRLPPVDASGSSNGNLNSIGSTNIGSAIGPPNGVYQPDGTPNLPNNDQNLPIF